MSLADLRSLVCCAAVLGSVALVNVARGDDSQFKLDDGSTDGDAVAEAVGRRDVKAVRSSNDRLSDASFATFSRWPELYGVYLFNTTVTGTGFRKFEKHEHLTQVHLLGPNVNDDGVRTISQLPHLTHLQIGNGYETPDCKYRVHHALVTDRALESIARMKKLRYLTIGTAAITDEGIQQLAALEEIRNIQFFRCTELTVNGIERLRAALPRATISAHVPAIAPAE